MHGSTLGAGGSVDTPLPGDVTDADDNADADTGANCYAHSFAGSHGNAAALDDSHDYPLTVVPTQPHSLPIPGAGADGGIG